MTSALSWNDLFGSSANVSTQASDTDYKHPCLRFTDHEYEVCSAYIANASLAVLVPYYKYANTGDGWTRYVTYRLGSRYIGRAHDQIQSRVASWPTGTNEVDAPHIEIMSVTSSLTTNIATLVTKESWRVQSSDRTVLYQEVDQQHVIMMQRVPSYILHKWVVTDVQ
jgi:hypothetical protein